MLSLLIESTLRSCVLALLVWTGLKILRVRNPYAEMIAWRIVLAAALAMPLLMQWPVLTLPAPTGSMMSVVQVDSQSAAMQRVDWRLVIALCCGVVTAVMLARLSAGLWRMTGVCRNATPIPQSESLDVRICDSIAAPVTFGNVVLVPPSFERWTEFERCAALEHERAHVANCDFHFLLAAQIYRALFWFNPLAWWLTQRLSALSEQISDDAAVRAVDDRAAYADMLLDLARRSAPGGPVVAMARPAGIFARIERLLAEDPLTQRWSRTRCTLLAMSMLPVIGFVAGCAAPTAVFPKKSPQHTLSQPIYPAQSRRAGQTGTVQLSVHVLEDGSVDNVRIKRSSGFARLDYAAANESLNWRLDPGTIEGKPAAMWGTFAVTFKLSD